MADDILTMQALNSLKLDQVDTSVAHGATTTPTSDTMVTGVTLKNELNDHHDLTASAKKGLHNAEVIGGSIGAAGAMGIGHAAGASLDDHNDLTVRPLDSIAHSTGADYSTTSLTQNPEFGHIASGSNAVAQVESIATMGDGLTVRDGSSHLLVNEANDLTPRAKCCSDCPPGEKCGEGASRAMRLGDAYSVGAYASAMDSHFEGQGSDALAYTGSAYADVGPHAFPVTDQSLAQLASPNGPTGSDDHADLTVRGSGGMANAEMNGSDVRLVRDTGGEHLTARHIARMAHVGELDQLAEPSVAALDSRATSTVLSLAERYQRTGEERVVFRPWHFPRTKRTVYELGVVDPQRMSVRHLFVSPEGKVEDFDELQQAELARYSLLEQKLTGLLYQLVTSPERPDLIRVAIYGRPVPRDLSAQQQGTVTSAGLSTSSSTTELGGALGAPGELGLTGEQTSYDALFRQRVAQRVTVLAQLVSESGGEVVDRGSETPVVEAMISPNALRSLVRSESVDFVRALSGWTPSTVPPSLSALNMGTRDFHVDTMMHAKGFRGRGVKVGHEEVMTTVDWVRERLLGRGAEQRSWIYRHPQLMVGHKFVQHLYPQASCTSDDDCNGCDLCAKQQHRCLEPPPEERAPGAGGQRKCYAFHATSAASVIGMQKGSESYMAPDVDLWVGNGGWGASGARWRWFMKNNVWIVLSNTEDKLPSSRFRQYTRAYPQMQDAMLKGITIIKPAGEYWQPRNADCLYSELCVGGYETLDRFWGAWKRNKNTGKLEFEGTRIKPLRQMHSWEQDFYCGEVKSGCTRTIPEITGPAHMEGLDVRAVARGANPIGKEWGTSWSAPAITGLAALMVDRWPHIYQRGGRGQPELIKAALMAASRVDDPSVHNQTAKGRWPDSRWGAGVPDARLIESLQTPKLLFLRKTRDFSGQGSSKRVATIENVVKGERYRVAVVWSACDRRAKHQMPGAMFALFARMRVQPYPYDYTFDYKYIPDNTFQILEFTAPHSGRIDLYVAPYYAHWRCRLTDNDEVRMAVAVSQRSKVETLSQPAKTPLLPHLSGSGFATAQTYVSVGPSSSPQAPPFSQCNRYKLVGTQLVKDC